MLHWLLESSGMGLLTGKAGVDKTAVLHHLTADLNPPRSVPVAGPRHAARPSLGSPVTRDQGPHPIARRR